MVWLRSRIGCVSYMSIGVTWTTAKESRSSGVNNTGERLSISKNTQMSLNGLPSRYGRAKHYRRQIKILLMARLKPACKALSRKLVEIVARNLLKLNIFLGRKDGQHTPDLVPLGGELFHW